MTRTQRSSAALGRPVLVGLLVGALGLGLVGLDGSVDPAVAQSLETREAELAAMRQQIDALRGRLGAIESRERSLEDTVERVETELDLQRMRLDEAVTAAALASDRAAAAEREIERLGDALDAVRGDLRRRLAGLYRLGRQGYLRLVFSLRDQRDALPAIRQLRFLALRDQTAIERWTRLRARLAEERERLEAQRREMAAWEAEETSRRDALEEARARHRDVLEEVSRQRRVLSRRTEALEDKERKLARFVAALVDDESQALDGAPIQDFRGVLDWPVQGEVTTGFGPRRDARYRTEVPHPGLDLSTERGARVRTVFPGEILFASDFEGYGPTVVVHHPGRVFTLYAGLDLLNVGKGDVVRLGDVLGASAESLYFEIRVENKPEDPRRWLR